jgi:hypothetical protein
LPSSSTLLCFVEKFAAVTFILRGRKEQLFEFHGKAPAHGEITPASPVFPGCEGNPIAVKV